MMETQSYKRYQRQILLSGFGQEGQEKILQASVVVIGAGGLGCPALQYLVAAGVGRIGIVDDDVVSLHNLHRQVLFTTGDIGKKKTEAAAGRLRQMNPDVVIETFQERLTTQNAIAVLNAYDLVLDATDNFATRYLVNDACVLLKKPLIYGAISQFEGQVAVFNAGENAVNYRDLFPQPPAPGSVLNCAEAGVLGVLPGITGTLQATEVIKLITGIGQPLRNQLFTYNALTNESFVFALPRKKETGSLLPKSIGEFERMLYEEACESPSVVIEEITAATFADYFSKENTAIIDVREEGEQPDLTAFPHRKIPLSELKKNIPPVEEDTVVLFCQSGKRSREAASLLSATFGNRKKIYSLSGGILNWTLHGKEKA